MARGNPNWLKREAEPLTRAKVLPPMGEQPVLHAAEQNRPPETPNPLHNSAEPFSFPSGRVPYMPGPVYDSIIPRRVVEAELEEMMAWGIPRFLKRFPRVTSETIKPVLILGVRGGKMAFFRTQNVCGLFCAEVTPWEPELTVYEVFVVSNGHPRTGEVFNTYRAGALWANQIGACAFRYGSETGVDIEPIAERIGYDFKGAIYIKICPVNVIEFGGHLPTKAEPAEVDK